MPFLTFPISKDIVKCRYAVLAGVLSYSTDGNINQCNLFRKSPGLSPDGVLMLFPCQISSITT